MHSICDTVLITSGEIPRDLLRDRKIIRFRLIIRFGLTPVSSMLDTGTVVVLYTLRFHTTMDDPCLLREILKAEQTKVGQYFLRY